MFDFYGRLLKGGRGCIPSTHTFDSQLAARPQKGQKQRGQLVFSQLICQSGPQTSDRVTVSPHDESRQRRRWGGGAAARSPVSLTSPRAGNSDGPGLCALEPGSGGDGGRVSCHSSGADVTRWLRCQRRGLFLNIRSLYDSFVHGSARLRVCSL